MILTAAEYASIYGASSHTEAWYTWMLTAIQDAVEKYCDRKFDEADYTEVFTPSTVITLREYPVTRITGAGIVATADLVLPDHTSVVVTDTAVLVNQSGTQTTIQFGANTISQIVTALNNLGIDVVIDTDYASLPATRLLPEFNRLRIKSDDAVALSPVPDSYRSYYVSSSIGATAGLWVSYTAGYSADNMPPALKRIVGNILYSLDRITALQGGGLLKSETITNYSYTLADTDATKINKMIEAYIDDLEPFRRKPPVE